MTNYPDAKDTKTYPQSTLNQGLSDYTFGTHILAWRHAGTEWSRTSKMHKGWTAPFLYDNHLKYCQNINFLNRYGLSERVDFKCTGFIYQK